jgi:peptide/nickel transport system permease protein
VAPRRRFGKKERIDDSPSGGRQDAGTVDEKPGVSLIASAWKRLRRDRIFLLGLAITISSCWWRSSPRSSPRTTRPSRLNSSTSPPADQPGPRAGARLPARRRRPGPRPALAADRRQPADTDRRRVRDDLLGLLGGLILGTLAGAVGGWVDSLVMRVVDVMLSIPSLLLAFSIAAMASKPSQWTVIIAIAIAYLPSSPGYCAARCWPNDTATTCWLRARSASNAAPIVFRHMLPNSLGPVIVQATLVLATAVIDAAALSFLGLGNPDDRQPEWGQMLGTAQEYLADYPHLAFYPAICIIVVALGFTLMGESLREALDPKSRR